MIGFAMIGKNEDFMANQNWRVHFKLSRFCKFK